MVQVLAVLFCLVGHNFPHLSRHIMQDRSLEHYPESYAAPLRILRLEANCGLIAAWSAFKYFRKRVAAARLIQCCRHSNQGISTIAMALALHELGLSVAFYTDPDPLQTRMEKRCYQTARSVGLAILPALKLETLLVRVDKNHLAIVLYNENRGAHSSPLLGVKDGKLWLPYASGNEAEMDEAGFIENWDVPEICRQCLIVSRN